MKKLISFTNVETKKIEQLKELEGLRTFSETVRACVRQWYDKKCYSKPYGNRGGSSELLKEKLAPEQECERCRGEVKRSDDGMMKCFFTHLDGNIVEALPLSMSDDFEVMSKRIGLI